jgi:hypothetical protein
VSDLALYAQVVGELAALCNQPDQGLGLVGVELIGNESPGGVWVSIDNLKWCPVKWCMKITGKKNKRVLDEN